VTAPNSFRTGQPRRVELFTADADAAVSFSSPLFG
jgi:hypothetical protein